MAIIGFVHECDHPASCFIPCMMRNIMPKSCMWRKRERERKREDGCGDSIRLLLGLGVAAMFTQSIAWGQIVS